MSLEACEDEYSGGRAGDEGIAHGAYLNQFVNIRDSCAQMSSPRQIALPSVSGWAPSIERKC